MLIKLIKILTNWFHKDQVIFSYIVIAIQKGWVVTCSWQLFILISFTTFHVD